MQECRSLQENAVSASSKVKEVEKMNLDLCRDMTRQYKAMEDELLDRINERENQVQKIKDDFTEFRESSVKIQKEKDNIIQHRAEEISILKKQLHDANTSFLKMLQNIRQDLGKWTDISYIRQKQSDVCSTNDNNDTYVSIQRKMEGLGSLSN